MVSLIFLLLGIPLMKAAYGLFEKLMRVLWTSFLVAFAFSFLYIICLGAATSALWAIHRERNGRRSDWQIAGALALLCMSMYLLTGPMLKETDFLFRITAEGVLVAGVLIVAYAGIRLHRYSRSGRLSLWASTGCTALAAVTMAAALLSFDRSWHVSRMALARGEEYPIAYQELKREKYRVQHIRFLEGRSRIAVKELYRASLKNREVPHVDGGSFLLHARGRIQRLRRQVGHQRVHRHARKRSVPLLQPRTGSLGRRTHGNRICAAQQPEDPH
jgi:hypothetical protein